MLDQNGPRRIQYTSEFTNGIAISHHRQCQPQHTHTHNSKSTRDVLESIHRRVNTRNVDKIHFLRRAAAQSYLPFCSCVSHFYFGIFTLLLLSSACTGGCCSHEATIFNKWNSLVVLYDAYYVGMNAYLHATCEMMRIKFYETKLYSLFVSFLFSFCSAKNSHMHKRRLHLVWTNEQTYMYVIWIVCAGVLTNIKSLRNIADRWRRHRWFGWLFGKYIFVFICNEFSNASHHAIDDRKSFC